MTDEDYHRALIRDARSELTDAYLAEGELDEDDDDDDWGDFRPHYSGPPARSRASGGVLRGAHEMRRPRGHIRSVRLDAARGQPSGCDARPDACRRGPRAQHDEITAFAATLQQESAETGEWEIAQEDVLG
jgi:hypothetical protein